MKEPEDAPCPHPECGGSMQFHSFVRLNFDRAVKDRNKRNSGKPWLATGEDLQKANNVIPYVFHTRCNRCHRTFHAKSGKEISFGVMHQFLEYAKYLSECIEHDVEPTVPICKKSKEEDVPVPAGDPELLP